MKKLIGISSRNMVVDGITKVFVNQNYLDYLEFGGFTYIILPLKLTQSVLEMCDGFLITGGYDMDPRFFKQEKNPSSVLVDRIVDLSDLQIIRHALSYQKPLLGICRGLQVLNVALEGSLKQDFPHHQGTRHEIVTNPSRIIPDLQPMEETNSFHHQVIEELGKDLIATGKAHDGVIEIIEHKTRPILAVQFHPEREIRSELSKKIMNAFVHCFN